MSVFHTRRALSLVVLAAVAALVAASTSAVAQTQRTTKKGSAVALGTTPVGKVLVGAHGMTLYTYGGDRKGTSNCYGKCASFWPPLLTGAKPRAGSGVKASLLGETTRKSGQHQVTYAGHPLYYFVKDAKPGDVNGQGLQGDKGVWWTMLANGTKDTTKPAPAAPPTVQLASTSHGSVLVDPRGMSLYLYTPDTSGTSTCYGQCATFWPPLLATGDVVAGTGLDQSLLGTTTRTDGKKQVTYAGHPLYFFAKDVNPGDTNGEGVAGVWFLVSASGDKV